MIDINWVFFFFVAIQTTVVRFLLISESKILAYLF